MPEDAQDKTEASDVTCNEIVDLVEQLTSKTLFLHRLIIEATGEDSGIRDENILNSALSAPFATFYGEDLHQTNEAKAAALMRSLTLNHAFVQGNKRIGFGMMVAFLYEKSLGLKDSLDDQEIINFCLSVAAGEQNIDEITQWIKDCSEEASSSKLQKTIGSLTTPTQAPAS